VKRGSKVLINKRRGQKEESKKRGTTFPLKDIEQNLHIRVYQKWIPI
jgi:hypothetical protein